MSATSLESDTKLAEGASILCSHHRLGTFIRSDPADYALFVDNQLLGIVEAKKVTLGPQNVSIQAERYARGAMDSFSNFSGCRVTRCGRLEVRKSLVWW